MPSSNKVRKVTSENYPTDERFGPRFPDMTEPYSLELRNLAKQTADELGIAYKEGVYMGFMGPCYETAAEIRAFAGMGADAVGMSKMCIRDRLHTRWKSVEWKLFSAT